MDAKSIDERVRELIAANDVHGAATEAIRALGPQVLRYLRSILRDEDEAADAFSRFAESVWRGLPGFRGEAPLRGWAFRLAFHAALSLKREAWNRHGRRLATSEASKLAEELRTKTYQRVERQRTAMDRLRDALTLDERSLLNLRIDQNLAWSEIADVLAAEGNPVDAATLMKRFERLKAKLARLVQEQGLTE